MKKPKQQMPPSPTLAELISTYDKQTVATALASMQGHDVAWKIFESFAKAKAAYHGSNALNLIAHGQTHVEAATAAGCEAGIRELITVDLPSFIKQLRGENGVVTPSETPEEE